LKANRTGLRDNTPGLLGAQYLSSLDRVVVRMDLLDSTLAQSRQ
jgi:hypothetical protein